MGQQGAPLTNPRWGCRVGADFGWRFEVRALGQTAFEIFHIKINAENYLKMPNNAKRPHQSNFKFIFSK